MTSMNTVQQTILSGDPLFPPNISLRRITYRSVGDAMRHLTDTKYLSHPSGIFPIGVAYHISSSTGRLEYLMLANDRVVYCVDFDGKFGPLNRGFATILDSGGSSPTSGQPGCCLVGFSLARAAVQVYHATSRLQVKGVDLSTLFTLNVREANSPADIVETHVSRSVDKWKVVSLWMLDESDERSVRNDVALQAWLAWSVGMKCQMQLGNALKVDTSMLNASELDCLCEMVAQADLVDSHKPKESLNDFTKITLNKFGKYEVDNARYKSRIRRSRHAQVIMTGTDGREHVGRAQGTKGRQTTIAIQGSNKCSNGIKSIKVVGRQEPTNAERARDDLLRLLLTGKKNLRESPFIRLIWFPQWKPVDLDFEGIVDAQTADEITLEMKLNKSQRDVVRGMVGTLPLVVTHGPPGTGKTTTIAAASRIWDLHKLPVWIIAHSNVAVKNIAETLYKKDVNFTLLVSKEFYEEWHEHLYTEVLSKVIRSDELPNNMQGMSRTVGDSCIMLCTLSMLSNPALLQNGTFEVVPVKRLVIDEASQISTFEFMPIFERFQNSLEKVAFFGDPKQLPPFGKDRVKTIKTIFDLEHVFNANAHFFLDTQYRMPVPIGSFVSKVIYGGRLISQHAIRDPDCVAFIDVPAPNGQEQKSGFSWKNLGEIDAIVHLVRHYYKTRNFCVITPYDAQRAAIQKALETEELPWDSVYNLDSFQGNEADYVLISVVRSTEPGFLVVENRMNVLLTRCRRATIIVSSEQFMTRLGGVRTVLGTMANHWRRMYNSTWVDWRMVANGLANLPDAFGPNRTRSLNHLGSDGLSARGQSIGKPRIPWTYQSPSGGFKVGALFSYNLRETPSSGKLDPPPDSASLVHFPPLTPTKMPILVGTWKNIAHVSAEHTIHKHSLLRKRHTTNTKAPPIKPSPRNEYSGYDVYPSLLSAFSENSHEKVLHSVASKKRYIYNGSSMSAAIYSRRH